MFPLYFGFSFSFWVLYLDIIFFSDCKCYMLCMMLILDSTIISGNYSKEVNLGDSAITMIISRYLGMIENSIQHISQGRCRDF